MAHVHYVRKAREGGPELCRWSLPARLNWREWNGEFVVWAADTGATLWLSTLAGETIKALHDGPASVEEIALRVFNRNVPAGAATALLVATFGETGDDTHRLLSVLNELNALGLTRADLS